MTIVTAAGNHHFDYFPKEHILSVSALCAPLSLRTRPRYPRRHMKLPLTAQSSGILRYLACALVVIAALSLHAADDPAADPHAVPVIDGSLGPCSVEFTVKTQAGAPVYNSKIRVHVAYGMFHKLDLEVGTNTDGKARFNGLPS